VKHLSIILFAAFIASAAVLPNVRSQTTQAEDSCQIKGNISKRTEEKIYHVPGQRYYDKTVIRIEDGERWFCTEEEALEAGWRKSKV